MEVSNQKALYFSHMCFLQRSLLYARGDVNDGLRCCSDCGVDTIVSEVDYNHKCARRILRLGYTQMWIPHDTTLQESWGNASLHLCLAGFHQNRHRVKRINHLT